MLLVLMARCGSGAAAISMTESEAKSLSNHIKSNLARFKMFCRSPHRKRFEGLKPTSPNHSIDIAGNYKNGDYRACIKYDATEHDGKTHHRFKFNYAIREVPVSERSGNSLPFQGHSAARADDAQLYLYRGQHYMLTTRQCSQYFAVIPFKKNGKTHLWIFSTQQRNGWAYEPFEQSIKGDRLLELLQEDLRDAWLTGHPKREQCPTPQPQPRHHDQKIYYTTEYPDGSRASHFHPPQFQYGQCHAETPGHHETQQGYRHYAGENESPQQRQKTRRPDRRSRYPQAGGHHDSVYRQRQYQPRPTPPVYGIPGPEVEKYHKQAHNGRSMFRRNDSESTLAQGYPTSSYGVMDGIHVDVHNVVRQILAEKSRDERSGVNQKPGPQPRERGQCHGDDWKTVY